ncbi:MAG: hypothetical protein NZM65_04835 [Flavobacteriales bacterium]|nr:hypothetical protein [Flavobacteriales bacterium]MDW8409997.1 hypothetical protein [Flavobacteriales bacterium]
MSPGGRRPMGQPPIRSAGDCRRPPRGRAAPGSACVLALPCRRASGPSARQCRPPAALRIPHP